MSELDTLTDIFLDRLVAREALRFGDFTLKSGRRSPYFVNTGRFDRGGDLALLGECYAALIAAQVGSDVAIIFGPAYKGIPLALCSAMAYERRVGRAVAWCFDRKEAKKHGDGGSMVGRPLVPGDEVVVVDDVLTAGTALRESAQRLQAMQVRVRAAVVAVDRQERGRGDRSAREELAAELAVPVHALLTIAEAVDRLSSSGRLDAAQADLVRSHLAGAAATPAKPA